jgi:long-chain fatty acid transport protein
LLIKKKQSVTLKPLVVAILFAASSSVLAGGFSLYGEGNGKNAGDFGAGVAAEANDASTLYYNPAGLTHLEGSQLVVSATVVDPISKFTGTTSINGLTNDVATGLNGTSTSVIPSFFYSKKVNAKLAWGLGVFVPFGLETDWPETGPTRYAATRTKLQVIDFSPAVATQLTDKLSFGFSFDLQFGSVDFNSVLGLPGAPATDSPIENHGTSTGLGAHAGLLYDFDKQTRVGINYQSSVEHQFYGSSVLADPLAGFSPFSSNDVLFSDPADLPGRTTLSIFKDVNTNLSLMGTAAYTQWSSIQELVLNGVVGPAGLSRAVVKENFRNTWRLAGGGKYKINAKWMARAGVGYDQTPVPSPIDRNLRCPDGDRIALAIGGHYQATKTIGIDVGWTHLFMQKTELNNTTVLDPNTSVLVQGSVEGHANLFGAQLTWQIT